MPHAHLRGIVQKENCIQSRETNTRGAAGISETYLFLGEDTEAS